MRALASGRIACALRPVGSRIASRTCRTRNKQAKGNAGSSADALNPSEEPCAPRAHNLQLQAGSGVWQAEGARGAMLLHAHAPGRPAQWQPPALL